MVRNINNIIFIHGFEELLHLTQSDLKKTIVNYENVEYIIPEPEAASGIKHAPKPEDLKDRQKQKEDEIKGDSQQILENAKNKYSEKA